MMRGRFNELSDNKIGLDYTQFSDDSFFDCTQIVEAYKIIIASSSNYDKYGIDVGGPDVVIKDKWDNTWLISRKELRNDYKRANLKKINLMRLKSDTEYTVFKWGSTAVKATRIPNKYYIKLKSGKYSNKKYYIVAKITDNGEVDRENMVAVPYDIFKREFRVDHFDFRYDPYGYLENRQYIIHDYSELNEKFNN